MSIVATEYDVLVDGSRRRILYRCQDHLGQWHQYGPVFTVDANFDPSAHASVVSAKVATTLAEREATEVIG